jgi:sulfide dehydrogenase [flavocytochrome c] flavoprotein chain
MHGVRVVRDMVASVDTTQRIAVLASGGKIRYDKLVLSPGVEMLWDQVPGLLGANQQGRILQAWKAGTETAALRRQLEAMPDGGVFAIAIPEAPYRCPPGPYERASVIAGYFKAAKPRSKVLILDANPDVTSKGALFKRVWAESYPGMIEYRPQHKATGVDAATQTLKLEVQEDVRADVLNVLPPMRAGAIAVQAGLANSNARWCGVNYLNFESTAARHIHVIGDAIQIAPAMPKSGHMANCQAKVVAAALVAELNGWEINPAPMLTNTCYSFVDARRVIHVASVHEYVTAEKTFKTVAGSGGLSPAPTELEASYAWHWARTIWADALA